MFSTDASYEKFYMSHTGITLQMKKFYTEQVLGDCHSDTVTEYRFCMAGRVLRLASQRPARVAMTWTPVSGRRRKGRPGTTWRRTFQADLALVGIRWEEAEDTAPDRSWRRAAARCALWHRWN